MLVFTIEGSNPIIIVFSKKSLLNSATKKSVVLLTFVSLQAMKDSPSEAPPFPQLLRTLHFPFSTSLGFDDNKKGSKKLRRLRARAFLPFLYCHSTLTYFGLSASK
jgi:hypothetical protein